MWVKVCLVFLLICNKYLELNECACYVSWVGRVLFFLDRSFVVSIFVGIWLTLVENESGE